MNPSFQHINYLLTEEALKQDIPPEVVKAIATQENGGWKQFDENGQAVISDDGGIGLMQLTNQSQFETELLKTDLAYNIKAGVTVLDQMYDSNVPEISGAGREVIENWYFPVMAYNGIKPVNSSVKQATGEKNTDAYQEKVFAEIKASSFLNDRSFADFGFKPEDFQYDPDGTDNIVFKKMSYTPTGKLNRTAYNLQKDDQAITLNTPALRSIPGGGREEIIDTLPEGALLTVTGPFQFDKDSNNTSRQFVWYPVRTAAGKTGFVSSAYLEKSDKPAAPLFKDVSANHRFYNDIAALSSQGIINGYDDGTFKPGNQVTRGETAIMVVRALDLPVTGSNYINVVLKNGIMGGYPDGSFGEKNPIT